MELKRSPKPGTNIPERAYSPSGIWGFNSTSMAVAELQIMPSVSWRGEIYTYIIQHIKQTIRRISPYGCRFLGKCHGSWIRVFKSTQGPDFAIGMADIRVFRGSGFFVYCGVLTYFALFSHFI